jgi:hypothetical protein
VRQRTLYYHRHGILSPLVLHLLEITGSLTSRTYRSLIEGSWAFNGINWDLLNKAIITQHQWYLLIKAVCRTVS